MTERRRFLLLGIAVVMIGVGVMFLGISHQCRIAALERRITNFETSVADLSTAITMQQLEQWPSNVVTVSDTNITWQRAAQGVRHVSWPKRPDPDWSLCFSNRLDEIKRPAEVLRFESNRITGRFAIDYSTNYAQ